MNITRKVMVDTLRFMAQPHFECSKCPMQDVSLPVDDCCDMECEAWVLKKAAQMLEDDGMIMKAWCRYGED